LTEPVCVLETITPDDTQTFSLYSVLGEIVHPESHIHSNLKENTLLVFVREKHPLGIFEQLFHDRTSFQVKSFTLWDDHPSMDILVTGWSDG
jgi:hypothetical protein